MESVGTVVLIICSNAHSSASGLLSCFAVALSYLAWANCHLYITPVGTLAKRAIGIARSAVLQTLIMTP